MIGDRDIVISIDGGINDETSKLVDTDIVVSGSYVLGSEDMNNSINLLR